MITSPGYPGNYPDDTACEWLITSQPGSKITLEIKEFLTEEWMDIVEFYAGKDSSTNDMAGQLHGSLEGLEKTSFKSSENLLYIKFVADESTSEKGFVLHYISSHDEGIVSVESSGVSCGNEKLVASCDLCPEMPHAVAAVI